jgi:hypothetical protein
MPELSRPTPLNKRLPHARSRSCLAFYHMRTTFQPSAFHQLQHLHFNIQLQLQHPTSTINLLQQFDNSYFHAVPEGDDDLLQLETDSTLFMDEKMRPIALEYKKDQVI